MKSQAKDKVKTEDVAIASPSEETLVEEKVTNAKAEPKVKEAKAVEITYFQNTKVTCSCGNSFVVGSTKPEIHVEVCYNCHPFFTGQAKFVDTEGRVEAFQRRLSQQTEKKTKKTEEKQTPERPKSLKEMLQLIENS